MNINIHMEVLILSLLNIKPKQSKRHRNSLKLKKVDKFKLISYMCSASIVPNGHLVASKSATSS